MHVCVIGGGIVGLASAWQLLRLGARVTLIEARPGVALEASYSNGGQLSYDYVAPLAGPGVLGTLPGWLLRPGSPLRLVPQGTPSFWHWCFNFAARCNVRAARATTAALLTLATLSRQETGNFLACQTDADLDYRENGKLVVFRDPRNYRAALDQMAFQSSLGSQQHALDAKSCLIAEPALAELAPALCGGILTPGEAVIDGYRLACALLTQIQIAGVHLVLGRRVTGMLTERGRIQAIFLGKENFAADHFVVAAGVGSRPLLAPLGVRLPIMPLKGYALTLPIEPKHQPPVLSVTDSENKIVFARLGQRLRIAGMVELGDPRPTIVQRRIATLLHQARQVFPRAGDYDAAESWAGLRPATPSGRPIIDRLGFENLWVNTGHGALGLTLALGSARLLADRITQRTPAVDGGLFRLGAG